LYSREYFSNPAVRIITKPFLIGVAFKTDKGDYPFEPLMLAPVFEEKYAA
jgi:hypothetical protein